jgi:hypothetical protein
LLDDVGVHIEPLGNVQGATPTRNPPNEFIRGLEVDLVELDAGVFKDPSLALVLE